MEHANMRADTSTPVGFWGPPTSTIDWCELNYEHNYYVAEFWNTISNSLFVLLGLYGLYRSIKLGFEPRFHLQFIGVMVTGFGSAMFHGTLQYVYQQCDETPMVWAMLVWIYIVYNNEIEQIPIKNASNYVIAFLTTIGVVFTAIHATYRFTTVFQVFFGLLAVFTCARMCMHYAEVRDPRARVVARSYVTSALIGFGFWLLDYHYCHTLRGLPVNPQGHAWWHIFMGISSYHGPIFMQYSSSRRRFAFTTLASASRLSWSRTTPRVPRSPSNCNATRFVPPYLRKTNGYYLAVSIMYELSSEQNVLLTSGVYGPGFVK